VLEDLDARIAGEELRVSLRDRRPEVLRLDFGDSTLRRCILALPFVDAMIHRFGDARVHVRARATPAALIRAHAAARASTSTARLRCDRGDELTIDLRPGVGGPARWIDAEQRTRLRVRSAPFPWRRQTPARHWVDAAVCAGLPPRGTTPRLVVPDSATSEARRLARERFGLLGGPLVALLPSSRMHSWGPAQFARVLQGLEREIGARGITLGGPPVPGAFSIARSAPPAVRAALLRLCCVAIGDDDGWSHVAAAVDVPVLTVHGRTCPTARRAVCRSRAALSAPCRAPEAHARRRPSRAERCLACLEPRAVVDAALRLAADRWPWDRLARMRR
jgi:hypothetical protein